jgi:serine/threonine protein phosphatase PrpC
MNLQGKLAFAGQTHPGHVRAHNEDRIGSDPELGLAVLADGMGGMKAGEVASGMAVEYMLSDLRERLARLEGTEDEGSGFSPESLAVRGALGRANEAIHHVARTQPQCSGMGTTVVLLLFYDDRVTIAHVGDSRLYRYRGGELELVTRDHSLVQELIDQGYFTAEEARHSGNRNVVTRALGIAPEVDVELQEDVVRTGDVFLLCSDGLNDMVRDEQIRELLARHDDDLQRAAQALVDAAVDQGGRDNVSVLLVRALKPFPARSGWLERLVRWFD